MTDKKVLWIRGIIAISVLIFLFTTLFSFFEKWLQYPIHAALLLISFITLANGVSYLSDIIKKNVSHLRVVTGLISVAVLLFVLFPSLNNKPENYIFWAWLITFYLDAILISLSLLLELFHEYHKLKVYSFAFALNSAIFFICMSAMIFRDESLGQGGIGILLYGAVLFLVCIIMNLLVVFYRKNINKREQ